MNNSKSIVLIPAYKPDSNMISLVSELAQRRLDIVIVDDGSGKEYRGLFDAAEPNAQIIHCEQNSGKGAAIKTGLEYIRDNYKPPYTVVTADADGQHRAKDIIRVSKAAKKRPGTLVLGCRTISREMPLRNWFGNFYTKIAFALATGMVSHDTQTGLRGFSDSLIPYMLNINGSRYEYEMNVLLHWARCNKPVFEIPIRTIYHDGNNNSHFNAVRDSFTIYGKILRFSAMPFMCFLLDILLFSLLLPHMPLTAACLCTRVVIDILYFFLLRRSVRRYFPDVGFPLPQILAFFSAELTMNTALLLGLCAFGVTPPAAKAIANAIMFFMTFIIQRKVLFS